MTHTTEFDMPLLDEHTINLRRSRGYKLYWGLLSTFFLCVSGALNVALRVNTSVEHGWGLTGCALLGGAIGSFLFSSVVLDALFPPERYQWLPGHRCGELADLCEKHPGLATYRNRVCYAGRRFTQGEFKAMQAWANRSLWSQVALHLRAAEREDCQRLYQVTDTTA